jgi:uncharacterized Zn-finger protein
MFSLVFDLTLVHGHIWVVVRNVGSAGFVQIAYCSTL